MDLGKILFTNKSTWWEESRKKPYQENDDELQEKRLGIKSKEPVYKYRKIRDKREINTLYQKRENSGSDGVCKSRIENPLNSKWSVYKEVFSPNQTNNFDLITIEEYKISDAIIDDDKYRKYKEPDNAIDTVMNRQENIYKSLDAFILRTIVSQWLLGSLVVILNNPGVSLDSSIKEWIFFHGNILNNNRRRERIFFVSLDHSRKFWVTLAEDLKSLFTRDKLHLYICIGLLERRHTFYNLRIIRIVPGLKIERDTHSVIDIGCDRGGNVLDKKEDIDKKYQEWYNKNRGKRKKRISNRIFEGVFKYAQEMKQ